jgi:hypothetical protein
MHINFYYFEWNSQSALIFAFEKLPTDATAHTRGSLSYVCCVCKGPFNYNTHTTDTLATTLNKSLVKVVRVCERCLPTPFKKTPVKLKQQSPSFHLLARCSPPPRFRTTVLFKEKEKSSSSTSSSTFSTQPPHTRYFFYCLVLRPEQLQQ